ncbi:MAG: sigma-70 family RNA polymerase sigma factor [Candidatus Pedobacter colombiensis]|uniref:Sigma-70 family RNA polymerase sigma factor n=1 Tax=Candidatus Pedobacter colombiensis TaxID=3121371 RepID=A0AAJ5W4X3_9SPHI|nr:sigma-70 family RNA polymerase sigma factor [Pedobacter sp.]WEK17645.1 MAG: sigma-70 family RNA polymerase sigma factor [Pedobacter sp.]
MLSYKQCDADLVALLREGDECAFTEIYQRYFQLLYTYAYKKLRDQDLVRDILHDFFASLWGNRDTIPAINNLSAYFFTVINRKLIDHFLHEQVAAKYVGSFAAFAENEEAKTDHLIREKQMIAAIEVEIQALPPRMREAFELSRNQHLSHKEIGCRMDISEKTVDRQISNALNILKGRLTALVWLMLLMGF